VAAVERLFRQGLEKDAFMMQAALAALSRDEGIKKDFLQGDREALLKRAWPAFDELRQSNRITHLYFTGPDRVNFLRVHQPNRYGDVIDRITTLRAAEVREPARGIELGPLGTFTLRVVVPWYKDSQLIGFLELGEEINHITEEVHGILGVDLLVLVHEEFLDPELWEKGRQMLGHQDDWGHFGATLVVGRAMAEIPEALIKILDQKEYSYEQVLQVVEAGRNLYIAFLPLTDISGREVGDFIVVQDVTGLRAGFQNSMAMIAAVSVLVGGIVFVIFYMILGKVERGYLHQREIELRLAQVNTEHQKIVQVEKLSAMGLMIGEIAHQLNNPLAGVVNMAQLAAREADDPERVKELLAEIASAGKDCHAFVRRMLDFTKLSSFERKQTDMNHLIEETVSLFKESAGMDTTVVSELAPDTPTLDVDPVLIRHALFNLLSNAAQANPPGGTISVQLSRGERREGHERGWCLSVADQGQGIPADNLDKIFTPFFTTRSEGTGLGLPVVQHVAMLHEGEISAINSKDGGALFALWLPDTRNFT
jgi:signal transduction histidine kinase